jgi:hypothetical protein
LQEYIEESNGEDIRIFVVGDKIIASMKRSSEVGEFRSNVHRGGSTEVITLQCCNAIMLMYEIEDSTELKHQILKFIQIWQL